MSTLADAPTAVTAPTRRSAVGTDRLFQFAWLIVALGTVGLILTLWPVWASKPELADKFLIPTFSAGLVYWAWPRFRAASPAPTWAGLPLLLLGTSAFTLGWYVVVQVAGRPIVVWWLTLAYIATVLGLILLQFGWRHAKLLVFPLVFCLFSLPMPGRVNNPLQQRLKQFTTTSAEKVLPWLGVNLTRNGFDLQLSTGGSLGVVDACSGIRSVTALTAIAVLVAYLRGFGLVRSLLLVGLTIGVIAVTNAGRVIVTGLLQHYLGQRAIEGWAHDALGIGVILVGLALVVGLSGLIAPRGQSPPTAVGPPLSFSVHGPGDRWRGISAAGILLVAAGCCLWCERFRIDHRQVVDVNEITRTIGVWTSSDTAIDELVKTELTCDQLLHREYENALGERIDVWVMFWSSAATTAHMHHPDICLPSNNWQAMQARTRSIPLNKDSAEVPVSQRQYRHRVLPDERLLFFWTQHGSHVLPDGIQPAETMSGHSWLFELLRGHQPVDQGARISVLIAMPTRGAVEPFERTLADFTRDFATELYRVCWWAKPVTKAE